MPAAAMKLRMDIRLPPSVLPDWSQGNEKAVAWGPANEEKKRKRQRAAALQDASRRSGVVRIPTGLGVRLPSAAFRPVSWQTLTFLLFHPKRFTSNSGMKRL